MYTCGYCLCTCMYCLCTCMYCLCTCMFCQCVCNAVHLCVFTFYGVFHIFCTSVYLLVLPVFFYSCVTLLVLPVFFLILYTCWFYLCFCTSGTFVFLPLWYISVHLHVFTCGGVDPEVVLFLVVPQFLDAGDGIL